LKDALELLDTLEFNYAENGRFSDDDLKNLQMLLDLNESDPNFFSEKDKGRLNRF